MVQNKMISFKIDLLYLKKKKKLLKHLLQNRQFTLINPKDEAIQAILTKKEHVFIIKPGKKRFYYFISLKW